MYRIGTWAFMPWLLWLTLRALDSGGGRTARAGSPASLVSLTILLVLLVMSDLIVVTWFIAPALLAAFVLVHLGQLKAPALLRLAAAMAAGAVLGRILFAIPDFYDNPNAQSVDLARMAPAIRNFAAYAADLTAANTAEALVWAAFVFIGLRRLAVALRLRREKDSPMSRLLFAVPMTRAHLFVAIFVPASAAASLAATMLAGKFPIPWVPDLWRQTRYVLPFLFLPLFIGWTLLPWNFAPAAAARTKWAAMAGLRGAGAGGASQGCGRGRGKTGPFWQPVSTLLRPGGQPPGLGGRHRAAAFHAGFAEQSQRERRQICFRHRAALAAAGGVRNVRGLARPQPPLVQR